MSITFSKKKKWRVRLTIGGETTHIAWCSSYEEAILIEHRKKKQLRQYDPDTFKWREEHAKMFA